MKNYSGKLNFSLTGIQNSAAFPVINGCATIIIRDVLISITKIDKKTVRIQMIINIPKLNTGPRTYIATGNIISKNKINFSMFLKTNNGPDISVTDAIISFSDKKNFKLEYVGIANATFSQGSGNGAFELDCTKSSSTNF